MRCCAPVSGRSLSYRADGSTDARCHRYGTYQIHGKRYCKQHHAIWKRHYEIVERIRSIPNRSDRVIRDFEF